MSISRCSDITTANEIPETNTLDQVSFDFDDYNASTNNIMASCDSWSSSSEKHSNVSSQRPPILQEGRFRPKGEKKYVKMNLVNQDESFYNSTNDYIHRCGDGGGTNPARNFDRFYPTQNFAIALHYADYPSPDGSSATSPFNPNVWDTISRPAICYREKMCSTYTCPDDKQAIAAAANTPQGDNPDTTCCDATQPTPTPTPSPELCSTYMCPQNKQPIAGAATTPQGDDPEANCCVATPIDCDGSWSTCSVDCTKTYTINTQPLNGGLSCETTDGNEVSCSPGEGNCPNEPLTVDCQASWSSCYLNEAFECKRRYTVHTEPSTDGTQCEADDGTEEICPPEYTSQCPTVGCTDEEATNYNPDATVDDGTCITGCIPANFRESCSPVDISTGEPGYLDQTMTREIPPGTENYECNKFWTFVDGMDLMNEPSILSTIESTFPDAYQQLNTNDRVAVRCGQKENQCVDINEAAEVVSTVDAGSRQDALAQYFVTSELGNFCENSETLLQSEYATTDSGTRASSRTQTMGEVPQSCNVSRIFDTPTWGTSGYTSNCPATLNSGDSCTLECPSGYTLQSDSSLSELRCASGTDIISDAHSIFMCNDGDQSNHCIHHRLSNFVCQNDSNPSETKTLNLQEGESGNILVSVLTSTTDDSTGEETTEVTTNTVDDVTEPVSQDDAAAAAAADDDDDDDDDEPERICQVSHIVQTVNSLNAESDDGDIFSTTCNDPLNVGDSCTINCTDTSIDSSTQDIQCLARGDESNCHSDDTTHCVQEIDLTCDNVELKIVEEDDGDFDVTTIGLTTAASLVVIGAMVALV